MSYKDEEIFEGARAIRPHLRELLGAEAEHVGDELTQYLDQSREGRRVGNLIMDLMSDHENTSLWMRAYLDVGRQLESTRSYLDFTGNSELPGRPQRVPAMRRYACPVCGLPWLRRSAGEEVPVCQIHLKRLVPVD